MKDEMYRLVLDVSTMRVIYFTDNLDEVLTQSKETLFFDYVGALPADMKLSSCWNWTLQGTTLVHSVSPVSNKTTTSIFDFNKQECLKYLIQRVNDARRALQPDCDLGILIRVYKHQMTYNQHDEYLDALAKINNMRTHVYVDMIRRKEEEFMDALKISEINREYYKRLLQECSDSETLYQLRDQISKHNMLELLPEYETRIN